MFTFRNFEDIMKILAPIALAFVPGGVLPAAAVAVIGKLGALMDAADETFTEAHAGTLKKEQVMADAELIANTASEASTGGQKETWEDDIKPNISQMVDTAVKISKIVAPGAIIEKAEGTAGEQAGTEPARS